MDHLSDVRLNLTAAGCGYQMLGQPNGINYRKSNYQNPSGEKPEGSVDRVTFKDLGSSSCCTTAKSGWYHKTKLL
jgi:hypothetical protein